MQPLEAAMRTTVNLDDELLASAREYVGDVDTPSLLRMALTALIQREAARRLAALGGSGPDFELPPRRRSAP
jgi:Arc/MetJ family transcription regulator